MNFFCSFEEASNSVPIWLDGVGCSSGSILFRLIDCTHNGIGIHDCTHNEDVALVCLGGTNTDTHMFKSSIFLH